MAPRQDPHKHPIERHAPITFFIVLSGVAAAVPGLTILLSNIGVPEGYSSALLGGLVTTTSAFIVGYTFINKDYLIEKYSKYFNLLAVLAFLLFLLFASLTVAFALLWLKQETNRTKLPLELVKN